jgi:hypothetical protein
MSRKINDYNNEIKEVFNFMSITRKYKVVGSAALKSSVFIQDYDLDNMFKTKGNIHKILNSLTAHFKRIFRDAYKNSALFIIDFKCGFDESYPEDDDRYKLRWDKEDIKKGYKILGNTKKKSFKECLLDETRMKMDVIYIVNGIFIELSEIYKININGHKNYSSVDVKNELEQEIKKYQKEGNYMKMLKRKYSLLKFNPNKRVMEEFETIFNGQYGMLYNLINQLKIIQNVCIQDFRRPNIDEIVNNLQTIKQSLSSIYQFYIPSFSDKIDKICKKNIEQIKYALTPMIIQLEKYLNKALKKII